MVLNCLIVIALAKTLSFLECRLIRGRRHRLWLRRMEEQFRCFIIIITTITTIILIIMIIMI